MGALTAVLDQSRGGGVGLSATQPSTGTSDPQGGAAATRRRYTSKPGVAGPRQGKGPGQGLWPGRCPNGDLIQQPHRNFPLGQAGHKISPLEVFKDLKINSQP